MYGSRSRRGFTLVELLVSIAIMAVLVGLLLSSVQKARATAARLKCQNNLKHIGLSLHQYHSTYSHFPPGVSIKSDADQYPFMSWHPRLLPYLESNALWVSIEAAYSQERNFLRVPPHTHISTQVAVFVCPADSRSSSPQVPVDYGGRPIALTDYLGIQGLSQAVPNGVLFRDSVVRIADILDGTTSTILVGERPPSRDFLLGWWYAGWGQNQDGSADMLLGARERPGPRNSCPDVGHLREPGATTAADCEYLGYWSYHTGGSNFLFCDGSVRLLSYAADDILPALATRSGSETVPPE